MISNYTDNELDELARIMRAEALSDGDMAMLLVGNVVINRTLADCLTFKNVNTIHDVIFQNNQFSGINNSLFQAKATSYEKRLAKRILNGEYFDPATNALWFYAPKNDICLETWYDQPFAGKFKTHCFYNPDKTNCEYLH